MKKTVVIDIVRVSRHPAYILFVICIIMPMIGAMIEHGAVWRGIILLLMQVPWATCLAYEVWEKAEALNQSSS